jgi:hypothetical protein
MKRLVVLIMLVLLALRGWAGDAMSVEMTMNRAAIAMPVGCPFHTHAAADADADAASSDPAGTDGCMSCDLCIPMAEVASVQIEVATAPKHAVPTLADVDFFSASPTPKHRPPIT